MAIIVGNNTSNTTIANTSVSLPISSSNPSNPVPGQLYYNTTISGIMIYNGAAWVPVDSYPGLSAGIPVTNITAFENRAPVAGTYWIQPTGFSYPFQCEYSGLNYRGSGSGFFRWWRSVDASAPTVNFYGLGLPWYLMMVEKEGSSFGTIGFGSNQTFNARSDTTPATIGTKAGLRVFFGGAGAHGIYSTAQTPCNWGSAVGAIGAGFDGSTCGSFPNGLIMGEGPGVTYTNRGGTWSFWFRWY
jgi:hypothetical protein